MRKISSPLLLSILLLGMVALAPAAQAIRLKNCAEQPQSVMLDFYSEQSTLTLAPDEVRYVFGHVRSVTAAGQTTTITHQSDEYCLNEVGELTLQRRRRTRNGRR